MHNYRFDIGDYRRRTAHLTLLEHGIYRSLIDTYYLNEVPFEIDLTMLKRTLLIRTDEEKSSFDNIIEEFFLITDDGYRHEHCDEVLEVIYSKSVKARIAANKRWKNEKCKRMNKGSKKNANASDLGKNASKKDANGMLPNYPTTQLPINPTTDDPDQNILVHGKPKTIICPHQKIIDLYHDNCPKLARVKIWNDKRKKHLLARWREDPEHQDLEFWEKYFKCVNQSDHLTGKNDRGWQATLEWLINPSNFAKVIEGNYQSNPNQPKNTQTETDQEYLDRVNAELGDDYL